MRFLLLSGHEKNRVLRRCEPLPGDMVVGPMTSEARPRVFVTRRISQEGLDRIAARTDADIWLGDLPPSRDELLRRVASIDGLLSMVTEKIDDELLERSGPQLKVVSTFAVGFDNIDVPACTRRGVAVGNTPGVLTETTADAD